MARLTLVAAISGLMVGATPAPAAAATPGWLSRLNDWRISTGVSALNENTTWDLGDYDHSLYMVKNDQVTHYEVSTLPYYTPEGDAAARNGNIEVNSTTAFTDAQAVDWWMAAPFHSMGMMDPRLTSTGFGSYREVKSGWQAGFTLDVLRGNSFTGGTYPVYFPGNGAVVPLTSYGGNEFPDPLSACPGYTAPTGLPVWIQVGGNVSTSVSAHSFTGNGVALAHCVIDSTNPSVGSSLTYRGGVIVIPQQPLVPGVQYVVGLTVNGVAYSWSFGVTATGSFAPGPPTITNVTPGNASATVTWNPPTDTGGTPITGYVVTAYIGSSAQATQNLGPSAASATFSGLTNGTAYYFTVAATNAAGTGQAAVSSGVTPGTTGASNPYLTYFNWFDKASPGMNADNIHLLNTSANTAHVSVSLSGATPNNVTIAPGAETYVTFPAGHIGGPVVVGSDQPVLASQRVQFYSSFNEVWGMTAAQAATTSYVNWFDRRTPGMTTDNIHVLNPGMSAASVTVSMPGVTPVSLSLAPGAEGYATFPAGTMGGPVKITATQPVIAAQRVAFFQSFNEVVAQSAAGAQTASYFNWFDTATSGMTTDNIHILNPGAIAATGTVTIPGHAPLPFQVAQGGETYVSFPPGAIGGPVHVVSDQPVLASQRVQFFSSFNEVPQLAASQALTSSHVMWFDKATPGMFNDNIHILNAGGVMANVTVSLAGSPDVQLSIAPGVEAYATFPVGRLGGPVTIASDQPVLASQRVEYFQTFNEVVAR